MTASAGRGVGASRGAAPGGHRTPEGQCASPRERVPGAPRGDLHAGRNRLGPGPERRARASSAGKGAGARRSGSALVPLTADAAGASGIQDGALRRFGSPRRGHCAGTGRERERLCGDPVGAETSVRGQGGNRVGTGIAERGPGGAGTGGNGDGCAGTGREPGQPSGNWAGTGTAVRGRCVGTRRGGPAPGHRAGALFQPGWRRSDGAERPERRRRPPRTPGRSARLGGAQAAGLSAFAGRLWLFPSLHRREFITQRLLSQIHEGRKEGLDVGGLAGYRGEAESRLDSELSPSLCFLLVALRRFSWRLWCSGA